MIGQSGNGINDFLRFGELQNEILKLASDLHYEALGPQSTQVVNNGNIHIKSDWALPYNTRLDGGARIVASKRPKLSTSGEQGRGLHWADMLRVDEFERADKQDAKLDVSSLKAILVLTC